MRTRDTRWLDQGPKLPIPPPQRDDTVNDLGWLSRGPDRRARREAEAALSRFLLTDGQSSPLPPDPAEPPPLPEPPPRSPHMDRRGS